MSDTKNTLLSIQYLLAFSPLVINVPCSQTRPTRPASLPSLSIRTYPLQASLPNAAGPPTHPRPNHLPLSQSSPACSNIEYSIANTPCAAASADQAAQLAQQGQSPHHHKTQAQLANDSQPNLPSLAQFNLPSPTQQAKLAQPLEIILCIEGTIFKNQLTIFAIQY